MSTSCRNENDISGLLINPVTFHPKLFIQLLPQVAVQVKRLRMNRIVLELALELALQEVPNLPSIGSIANVPNGTPGLPIRGRGRVEHDVYSVRHVHVQTGRSFRPRRV